MGVRKKVAHDDYEDFVEKFVPKKTTDDCYTPPLVYDAVADYVAKRYGLDKSNFVRPFWPGADYTQYDYRPKDVVLDNPPFSILSKIIDYYVIKDVKFFLFAPSLTIFSAVKHLKKINHIITDTSIVFENGANIKTGFVTNLDHGIVAESCPDLYKSIKRAVEETLKSVKKQVPKYEYPDEVLTAANLQHLAHFGVHYVLKPEECEFVRVLDAQRSKKKSIFGSGFLISGEKAAEKAAAEKAAAEKAAAEKADVHVWELSDREKEIVKRLGGEKRDDERLSGHHTK